MKPAAALAPTVRWFHCLSCGHEFVRRQDHDYEYCRWQHAELARIEAECWARYEEIAAGEIPALEYLA